MPDFDPNTQTELRHYTTNPTPEIFSIFGTRITKDEAEQFLENEEKLHYVQDTLDPVSANPGNIVGLCCPEDPVPEVSERDQPYLYNSEAENLFKYGYGYSRYKYDREYEPEVSSGSEEPVFAIITSQIIDDHKCVCGLYLPEFNTEISLEFRSMNSTSSALSPFLIPVTDESLAEVSEELRIALFAAEI